MNNEKKQPIHRPENNPPHKPRDNPREKTGSDNSKKHLEPDNPWPRR